MNHMRQTLRNDYCAAPLQMSRLAHWKPGWPGQELDKVWKNERTELTVLFLRQAFSTVCHIVLADPPVVGAGNGGELCPLACFRGGRDLAASPLGLYTSACFKQEVC